MFFFDLYSYIIYVLPEYPAPIILPHWDRHGVTPLMFAADGNAPDIVKLLLENLVSSFMLLCFFRVGFYRVGLVGVIGVSDLLVWYN